MLVLEAVCVEIYVAQCEPITRQDGAKKTEDNGGERPIEHALHHLYYQLTVRTLNGLQNGGSARAYCGVMRALSPPLPESRYSRYRLWYGTVALLYCYVLSSHPLYSPLRRILKNLRSTPDQR
jgi:hypothetical protein